MDTIEITVSEPDINSSNFLGAFQYQMSFTDLKIEFHSHLGDTTTIYLHLLMNHSGEKSYLITEL